MEGGLSSVFGPATFRSPPSSLFAAVIKMDGFPFIRLRHRSGNPLKPQRRGGVALDIGDADKIRGAVKKITRLKRIDGQKRDRR